MAQVLEQLEPAMPKAAKMLRGAELDTLVYLSLPEGAPNSATAIERVNAEEDCRARVVGIFPNPASLVRPGTAVLQ